MCFFFVRSFNVCYTATKKKEKRKHFLCIHSFSAIMSCLRIRVPRNQGQHQSRWIMAEFMNEGLVEMGRVWVGGHEEGTVLVDLVPFTFFFFLSRSPSKHFTPARSLYMHYVQSKINEGRQQRKKRISILLPFNGHIPLEQKPIPDVSQRSPERMRFAERGLIFVK